MRKVSHAIAVVFSVFLFSIMVGCNKNSNPQMKNPPKHVILIGFDGMSANSLKNGVAMPNYRSMMKRGSYTLKTRSV